jgi:hypothetical protein
MQIPYQNALIRVFYRGSTLNKSKETHILTYRTVSSGFSRTPHLSRKFGIAISQDDIEIRLNAAMRYRKRRQNSDKK